MIREIVFVGVGGALGAISRFGVTIMATRLLGKSFPWGTLVVNVAGCFAAGIVAKMLLNLEASGTDVRPHMIFWHRSVAVGFLGGFTTFSTFSADAMLALTDGRPLNATANVVATVLLCLVATWCGMAIMPNADPIP
jgi:CrcB protein